MPTADAPSASPTAQWFEAYGQMLELSLREQEPSRGRRLVTDMISRLRQAGLSVPQTTSTPYVNTIPPGRQPPMPGDRELERRIKSLIRWNAMAMVVRANSTTNVGGHIRPT
jgi:pyruvate dehydrogenase E1 component